MSRIAWDEYFAKMVEVVKLRSTCKRRQFGAIITLHNQIRGTGYNGAPAGMEHCSEIGCLRDELGIESGTRHEICRAVHAEQNAILRALEFGNINGATIYTNSFPCQICAKLIINSGVKRVVTSGTYSTTEGIKMLEKAGVKVNTVELSES
jgi:dCMP deaminase